jgi:peptidoglycan/xylan/chitin deacetylase (PgdA/CDA1 family)
MTERRVRGSLRVLAYHGFAEAREHPVLHRYSVPARAFRAQLRLLRLAGYRFVGVDESLRFLRGEADLPARSLLLTFDDCYEDLVTVALPILRELRLTGAAFAVSGRLGGVNDWTQNIGTLRVPLLDARGLATLAAAGIEIGSHSRTHPELTALGPDALRDEIDSSVAELAAAGLPAPRLFAYPFGEHDEAVRRAAARAGLLAAFTVDPARARAHGDLFAIPRIEIWREDMGWALLKKVELAGRTLAPRAWMDAARRRLAGQRGAGAA